MLSCRCVWQNMSLQFTMLTPTQVWTYVYPLSVILFFDCAIGVLLYYVIWLSYSSHCQATYNISNKALANNVSHMLPTANYYFSPNDIAVIVIALCVVFAGLWSGRQCMQEVDVSTLYTVDEYTVIFSSFCHVWLVLNECGYIMLALYLCPCTPLCTTEYYPANHATELWSTMDFWQVTMVTQ
jgi:hypothetical protein